MVYKSPMVYCQCMGCDKEVHTYDGVRTPYCFYHAQQDVYRVCRTCKNYRVFRRGNKDCYDCVIKTVPNQTILSFMNYTAILNE